MNRDPVGPRAKASFYTGVGVVLLLAVAGVVAWLTAERLVIVELEIRAATSTPAEVWIGGEYVGDTPLELDEKALARLGERHEGLPARPFGSRIEDEGLGFESWLSAPDRAAGEQEYSYKFRTGGWDSSKISEGEEWTKLRIRVVGPGGGALVCVGRTENVTWGQRTRIQHDVLEFAPIAARPLELEIVTPGVPAQVRVGGELIGLTPLTLGRDRLAGLHDIVARDENSGNSTIYFRNAPWRFIRLGHFGTDDGDVFVLKEALHADEAEYALRVVVEANDGAKLEFSDVDDVSVDDDYRLQLVFER